MTMASRIAVMSQGQVLQVGTPREIYETPNCRFVADFIGNVNLFDGTLVEDEVDRCVARTVLGDIHIGHGITGTLNMPLTVAVRPEKIEIGRAAPGDQVQNRYGGVVKEIGYFGSYTTYLVQAAGGERVRITEANTERHAEQGITWEDHVHFWWDPECPVVLTS